MGCQGIPLVTRGMIFIPNTEIVEGITRYILPLNLQLKTNPVKINLKVVDLVKLSSSINIQKLQLKKLTNLKLNTQIPSLKLSLKECGD